MSDSSVTINQLKDKINSFMDERDWRKFHSLKNLSMYISIESSELMHLFLWANDSNEIANILQNKRKDIESEIADVAILLLRFCEISSIDLTKALEEKMAINAIKYPIDKAKGNSKKYNEL